MRRLTVIADRSIEHWLEEQFVERGATGFTSLPCSGAGRRELEEGVAAVDSKVRIEVVMTHHTCEKILLFLRQDVLPEYHVTTCVETVDVLKRDQFEPAAMETRAQSL